MSRRYLLDTHVVIALGSAGGFEAMPVRVRRILEDPEAELLLSVASQAEVAIKSRIGKLHLSKNELVEICTSGSIAFYPLSQSHVDQLFGLPLHHKDPFDRLIIATALSDDVPLISRDRHFRRYRGLKVIW